MAGHPSCLQNTFISRLRKPSERKEKRRKIHKQVDLPIAFAIVEVFFTA